ncbi:efflux RND transporter periplasmic adaptor subunit, partial [Candidatus Gracilibacteria bacterium]|nr:efflux RND transporter periplasmic adaptor subunit [Candidatus Gracilibacteria bacterium]
MKKIVTYILIVLVVGTGGYFGYKKIYPTATTTGISRSITVATGSIRSVVKVTGKVYPVQESNLTFTKQGTITAIYKKVGDTVRAGDLIAELDAKSVKLDLASSKINLSNAQNNLNKVLEGTSEINKIKAQNTLSESQSKLILLEKQYEALVEQQKNTISTSEANIKSLEDKLALAQNDLKYTEENINTTTTTNNIERDVANAYSLIESSYQLITPSLKTLSDTLLLESQATSTYGAIGENNPALKLQMEKLYIKLKEQNDTIQTSITEVRANSNSLTTILVGLTQMRASIGDLSSLTALSVSVLRASKTGIELPTDYLDRKISEIESLNSSVSSKYSSINSTLATLKNYGNDSIQTLANNNSVSVKKIALNTAQNDLIKAKSTLEELKKTNESNLLSSRQNIEAQKNAIKLNEASYKDMMNSSNTDIVSAKNSIQSSQISVQKSELTLRDYQIYATFDGVIRNIPWVVGDTVTTSSSTQAENISITNSGGYEIQVSLDQVDIVKIREGMSAKISLDAYADSTFTGTVSAVSPTPIEASNVVSYTAKILMPAIDKEIYSNMSATVQIIIAEKNNVLVIPTRATKSEK